MNIFVLEIEKDYPSIVFDGLLIMIISVTAAQNKTAMSRSKVLRFNLSNSWWKRTVFLIASFIIKFHNKASSLNLMNVAADVQYTIMK